jgi:uncharacterized protein (DUF302 family)
MNLAIEGLIALPSTHSPAETLTRLEAAIAHRDVAILARVDHAAAAEQAGMSLAPTTVLIFGNAKVGTPLMQVAPSIGIDLPLKALVWMDAAGKTWLAYNDPGWLARRHGIGGEAENTLRAMTGFLDAVAKEATASP